MKIWIYTARTAHAETLLGPAEIEAIGLCIVTAWQGLTFAWHSARTLCLGFIEPERARLAA